MRSEPRSDAAVADAPQKRARPFQFSLRTLCLVVICYTLAWGLTVAWGERSLKAEALGPVWKLSQKPVEV